MTSITSPIWPDSISPMPNSTCTSVSLSVILESVARVTAVAAGDIEATTHAVPLTNVYRPDVPIPGLSQEQALAGAPSAQDGRFRVPQILGEEQ